MHHYITTEVSPSLTVTSHRLNWARTRRLTNYCEPLNSKKYGLFARCHILRLFYGQAPCFRRRRSVWVTFDSLKSYCPWGLNPFADMTALGRALAAAKRPLIYGGGWNGLMGVVSSTVLEEGGKVVGVIPNAMVRGGEDAAHLDKIGKENSLEMILVDSMHERKVEMAKRAGGFIALPGGFGTFEEVLEATTWTQLGIHDKPIILFNVLKFWEPLRVLIETSIDAGFIRQANRRLITFVDGPSALEEHEFFDWGNAGLDALDRWEYGHADPLFDWSKTLKGNSGKKNWDDNMNVT